MQFVLLGLIPALAVAIPYGYLMSGEAQSQSESFWQAGYLVIFAAPFLGYGTASLLAWLLGLSLSKRRILFCFSIPVAGSLLTLAIAMIYNYVDGRPVHISWKRVAFNYFQFWGV